MLNGGAAAMVLRRHARSSAAGSTTTATPPDGADLTIRGAVLAALERQAWWQPAVSNVVVIDGVAILQGLFDRQDMRLAARAVARGVAGVRRVRDDRVRASS